MDTGTTGRGPALDHVGIAVDALPEAIRRYRDGLGMDHRGTETVPQEGVEVAFMQAGSASVELLAPTEPEGTVAAFLQEHGPGIHHLSFHVDDLEAAIEQARRQGLELVGDGPRPGSRGTRVAFFHPKSTGGVLIEYCEETGETPGASAPTGAAAANTDEAD